jgi:single-stranded DNA-binding protein
MQAFLFSLAIFPPPFAIRFRNSGLQGAAMAEMRQVRRNGANFTALSVATSTASASPSAESLLKGDHVLMDGQLVISKYERENAKSKKSKAAKVSVFWSVRANAVRRLSRAEAEAPMQPHSSQAAAESGGAPWNAVFCLSCFPATKNKSARSPAELPKIPLTLSRQPDSVPPRNRGRFRCCFGNLQEHVPALPCRSGPSRGLPGVQPCP